MTLHIAIPEPTSSDSSYNQRSLPQYIAALHSAGALATIVPLHERPERIARLLATTQGLLLPGSGFDVDPSKYGEAVTSECGPIDSAREVVDAQLLEDAFKLHKPVLGICYGVQSLNVWLKGSLIQDLARDGISQIDHAPGRDVREAHVVRISPETHLARLAESSEVHVNSSHHQAIRRVSDRLKVSAVSEVDGVIEGVELDSSEHYVVGVQWHPERTVASSALSRAIFHGFAEAASRWTAPAALPSADGSKIEL